MYFNQFPGTTYDFPSVGKTDVEVMDILRRVAFRFEPYFMTNRPTMMYTPEFGDTVDIIAHKVYGNSDYWWLVALFTNTINPFNELPRTGADIEAPSSQNTDTPSYEEAQSAPREGQSGRIYLERDGDGGSRQTYRDFKLGDYVALAGSTLTTNYETPRLETVSSVPVPVRSSNGSFTFAKIIEWDPKLRKATLGPVGGSGDFSDFAVGERVVVMGSDSPTGSDISVLSVYGTIRRQEDVYDDEVMGFVDKDTGRSLNPFTSVFQRKVIPNSSGTTTVDGREIVNPPNDANTLISSFLDFAGTSSSFWDAAGTGNAALVLQSYLQDGDTVPRSLQGKARRLRLLTPEFKDEAYTVFKNALEGSRFNINTFSSIETFLRSESSLNGGGGSSSITY